MFDQIKEQIDKDVAKKKRGSGTIVTEPGSEIIHFDSSTLQWMECMTGNRKRYCIIEKGGVPKYANSYTTSKGDPLNIITKNVFMLTLALVRNLANQIKKNRQEITNVTIEKDSYKIVIDSLRKNGVID